MYVSRDLDSRFSDREHEAVEEWLKSDRSVHVMRDHVTHDFTMLGGLWGTKLFDQSIRSNWKTAWENGQDDGIMYAMRYRYKPDQIFLDRLVILCFRQFI